MDVCVWRIHAEGSEVMMTMSTQTTTTTPQVGDRLHFWALNATRNGRIEKVGPRRVLASYVTKKSVAEALRHAKRIGQPVAPARYTRYFPLVGLEPSSQAGAWRIARRIK
jgi:hypothetical protein